MPEGWQLTPKRNYFLRKRMAWGITLLLCQGQLPLCQLRNFLPLVHFHFNPLIMVKQTLWQSGRSLVPHTSPVTCLVNASLPFFTSLSSSLWFVSVDRTRLLAMVTVLAAKQALETWAIPSAPDKPQTTLWDKSRRSRTKFLLATQTQGWIFLQWEVGGWKEGSKKCSKQEWANRGMAQLRGCGTVQRVWQGSEGVALLGGCGTARRV